VVLAGVRAEHPCDVLHLVHRGLTLVRVRGTGLDGERGLGRILVVAFTWREGQARLISARKATPAERRQYERGK
jgi:hypothetical protein